MSGRLETSEAVTESTNVSACRLVSAARFKRSANAGNDDGGYIRIRRFCGARRFGFFLRILFLRNCNRGRHGHGNG